MPLQPTELSKNFSPLGLALTEMAVKLWGNILPPGVKVTPAPKEAPVLDIRLAPQITLPFVYFTKAPEKYDVAMFLPDEITGHKQTSDKPAEREQILGFFKSIDGFKVLSEGGPKLKEGDIVLLRKIIVPDLRDIEDSANLVIHQDQANFTYTAVKVTNQQLLVDFISDKDSSIMPVALCVGQSNPVKNMYYQARSMQAPVVALNVTSREPVPPPEVPRRG